MQQYEIKNSKIVSWNSFAVLLVVQEKTEMWIPRDYVVCQKEDSVIVQKEKFAEFIKLRKNREKENSKATIVVANYILIKETERAYKISFKIKHNDDIYYRSYWIPKALASIVNRRLVIRKTFLTLKIHKDYPEGELMDE